MRNHWWKMKKPQLLFIPSPGLSHLIPTVETAKLLLHRDSRLAVTVLLLPQSIPDANAATYVQTTSSNPTFSSRLSFIHLSYLPHTNSHFFEQFDVQITNVRDAVSDIVTKQPDSQIAGIVLDIFCTEFVDVAVEFHIPAYVFFTAGAAALGVFQHLTSLRLEKNEDLSKYRSGELELSVPYYSLPLPGKVLPAVFMDDHYLPDVFFNHIKRVWEMKGVLVNTFHEFESHAIESLLSDGKTPEIYPVGPVLSHDAGEIDDDVKKWLDDQPEKTVVFVCFGTAGGFEEIQVREIAEGLERSGRRFLWSLRKPGFKEYEDLDQVLPEGFSERTKGVGKVMGWVAQVAVLAHAAVGGFVSHCGWNSTLESVWHGVPIATFPLHAEQHLNAFYLVREMEMAEEITLDYMMDNTGERPPQVVGWEVIAAAIGRLMAAEGGSGVREKVEEMRRKARAALVEGGTSYVAQGRFIEGVLFETLINV